jgi:hypothetical protein
MTNTENLRHDIQNIIDEVIVVDGERFRRLPHWAYPLTGAPRWSNDFGRVDGGYNAAAEQLARTGFTLA